DRRRPCSLAWNLREPARACRACRERNPHKPQTHRAADEGCGPGRREPPPLRYDDSARWRSPGAGSGSAQLCSRRAGCALGGRYHLHPNLVWLSLPCHRARRIQPQDRWLVDVADAARRCRACGAEHGARSAQAKERDPPDQGSQYTSIAFGNRCREAGVRPSMGSVGDAYDNAMAESFFATLECELLERRRFKTQAEARMAVFAFIEGFYNPSRRHSALGYLSPMAFERQHAVMMERRAGSSPGAQNHAAVLVPIKHKPSRARKLRVLDSACARRQSLRVGRDEGTGSPGAEPRNCIDKEDDTVPPNQLH